MSRSEQFATASADVSSLPAARLGCLDSHIDVAQLDDLVNSESTILSDDTGQRYQNAPENACAFTHIGQLIKRVSRNIFSLANLQNLYDQHPVDMTIIERGDSMQETLRNIPIYLHLFDWNRMHGQAW